MGVETSRVMANIVQAPPSGGAGNEAVDPGFATVLANVGTAVVPAHGDSPATTERQAPHRSPIGVHAAPRATDASVKSTRRSDHDRKDQTSDPADKSEPGQATPALPSPSPAVPPPTPLASVSSPVADAALPDGALGLTLTGAITSPPASIASTIFDTTATAATSGANPSIRPADANPSKPQPTQANPAGQKPSRTAGIDPALAEKTSLLGIALPKTDEEKATGLGATNADQPAKVRSGPEASSILQPHHGRASQGRLTIAQQDAHADASPPGAASAPQTGTQTQPPDRSTDNAGRTSALPDLAALLPAVESQTGSPATAGASSQPAPPTATPPNRAERLPESAHALAGAIVATSAGEHRPMSVRLDLSHLGTVEISVDQGSDGTALKVSTDRKETLDTLISDQGSLRSMLQQSGIDDPGSQVQFTMLGEGTSWQNSQSHQEGSERRQSGDRRDGQASIRSVSVARSVGAATVNASAGRGSVDITA